MGQVWGDNGVKGSMKLLLLAIADFADDNGKAWPSVETLAQKIGMGERNTRYMLRALEDQGRLVVDISGGPKGSSMYRILAPDRGQSLPPAKSSMNAEGGQNATQGGGKMRHKGGQPTAPDPSLDPPIDPSVGQQRAAALPPAPPIAPPPPVVLAEPQTATAPEPTVAAALDGDPLPAAPAPATTKNLAQQPVVLAYRDVFLAYPSKAQMAQLLGHGVTDMQRWSDVLAAWCKAGYSPRNIGGMLDWYDDPVRMATSGAKGAKPGVTRAPAQSKVAASLQAVDDVFAMLERSGGKD